MPMALFAVLWLAGCASETPSEPVEGLGSALTSAAFCSGGAEPIDLRLFFCDVEELLNPRCICKSSDCSCYNEESSADGDCPAAEGGRRTRSCAELRSGLGSMSAHTFSEGLIEVLVDFRDFLRGDFRQGLQNRPGLATLGRIAALTAERITARINYLIAELNYDAIPRTYEEPSEEALNMLAEQEALAVLQQGAEGVLILTEPNGATSTVQVVEGDGLFELIQQFAGFLQSYLDRMSLDAPDPVCPAE